MLDVFSGGRLEDAPAADVKKAKIEELAARARRGDRDSLMELCRSIARNVLFRVSCKLRTRADAEDVAQEVLIRICSNIRELKDPKAFGAWYNRIIINETNRYLLKNSKHGVVVSIDDYLEGYKDTVADEDEDFLPAECAILADDRRIILEIVSNLPERQHDAIMLHYFEGLSVIEVARAMNITKQSVIRHLDIARDKIKNEIQFQAKKTDALRGVALMPIGPALTQVLYQEAAHMQPLGDVLISKALVSQADKIIIGAVNAGNSGQAAGISAAAIKTTVAGLAATAVVVTGLMMNIEPPDEPSIAEQLAATGNVVFSGGDTQHGHMNPTGAVANTDSVLGELTVQGWKITTKDGSSVLHSGSGGDIGDALERMQVQAEKGEYILVFSLEDARGDTYKLSRTFLIS